MSNINRKYAIVFIVLATIVIILGATIGAWLFPVNEKDLPNITRTISLEKGLKIVDVGVTKDNSVWYVTKPRHAKIPPTTYVVHVVSGACVRNIELVER